MKIYIDVKCLNSKWIYHIIIELYGWNKRNTHWNLKPNVLWWTQFRRTLRWWFFDIVYMKEKETGHGS